MVAIYPILYTLVPNSAENCELLNSMRYGYRIQVVRLLSVVVFVVLCNILYNLVKEKKQNGSIKVGTVMRKSIKENIHNDIDSTSINNSTANTTLLDIDIVSTRVRTHG